MKCLLLIVILAISSSSSYNHHNNHDHFGPRDGHGDGIQRPWWHPQRPPGLGMDLDPGVKLDVGFNPFKSGDGNDPLGFDGGRWHPWEKYTTTTKIPSRVTYPIFRPTTTSTTERSLGPGSSTAIPNGLEFIFYACMASCSVTPDDNPVCGTNNVTYDNIGRLECARLCGIDVKLSRNSPCSVPPNPGFGDVIKACIQTCSVTTEFNPVCGTDNVTYTNPGALECARNCGRDVQISRKLSCSIPPGPGNPDIRGSTTETPISTTETLISTSEAPISNGHPSMIDMITCMQLCPMTPELNPVCGTDGVTYSNPGKLLCVQFCGIDVKVKKFAPCLGKPIPNSHPFVCPTLPPQTEVPTNPTTTQDCVNKCPVSEKFKPVCGTDGMTYINLESLECRMKCGVDVSVLKLSACEQISTDKPTAQTPPVWGNTDRPIQPTVATPAPTPGNDRQTCIKNCVTSEEYKPVCGTNGETYANIQKLQCAKLCGINVDLKSESACVNSPIVVETTTEDNNGLGFTIAPEVLASIFNIPIPTTQPTTTDDDSYEVDQRFQDRTTKK